MARTIPHSPAPPAAFRQARADADECRRAVREWVEPRPLYALEMGAPDRDPDALTTRGKWLAFGLAAAIVAVALVALWWRLGRAL